MTITEQIDQRHQEDLQRLRGFRLLDDDFFCTDPTDMYYDVLAERVRFFKESKEGIAIMCKVMEDMRIESLKEGEKRGMEKGMKATALRMLEAGKYALEEIAEISGLSLDEVKKLHSAQTA